MKKIVALAVTASALLAGPDIGNLVDYDAQDNYVAQTQEAAQYIPAPIAAPIVIAPALAPVAPKSCCSNRDSVDLMGGYNFTEDDGALDDAATAGIRYNKNIAPNTYIQLGYDRVFNADYRNSSRSLRGGRSVSGGGSNGSGSGQGGGSNGSGSNGGSNGSGANGGSNGNGNGTGSNSSGTGTGNGSNGGNTGNGSNNNGNNGSASYANGGGTQLDRFYLNGLYEFCDGNRLTPYIFGGLGYENVRHESKDLESGGFVDAGAGLKYQISEDLNLITEAKALKKFDNHDLDIVAGLGIGIMFGAATQVEPTPEIEIVNPTPSIIPAYAPAVAQRVPGPSSAYDNLDVVPIEESGGFKTRTVFNEPARTYDNYDVVSIEEKGTTNNSRVATSGGNYYIQVAALFSNDGANSNYFRKLDSAGLDHEVKQTTVGGRPVKLLLVGPYNSSSDARADLRRAKSIERGAFIKKFNG